MKNSKLINLLQKNNMGAKVTTHYRDNYGVVDIVFQCVDKILYIVDQSEDCKNKILTVKELIDILTLFPEDTDVKMHCKTGLPLLFVIGYVNYPDVVVFEDASDNDLSSELSARFEYAAEEQLDELDFFMDLLDTGFTLEDIKLHLPEKYEYSKRFMEEHGLI